MIITIRLVKSKDKDQVLALWTKIFPTEKYHNKPNIAFDQKIKHKDNLFFVAERNNTIIGTILAGYDGHRGWIYSLAVEPAYQRQKIGTHLLTKAIEELKKQGCLKINLQITGETSPLVDFYKTLGFRVEKRISMGKTLHKTGNSYNKH
jgi:ribosomal protein S18 acetylase RimI-like enzyme